ncbi:hypothetical protein ACIB24_13090 [Spongisporangium articulatum]|uniref:Uncharacterized protein n=1 Tax=Spongisporangium articulatum TaxID=3362603 RepID=A0ABW8ANP4_9ACTN
MDVGAPSAHPHRQARLRYHLQPDGGVWYHDVPAGEGRLSGNHVLVDGAARARALGEGFVRPIELWESSRWLGPSSVAVVRYRNTGGVAGLDEVPVTGGVVDRSSVVDFLGDPVTFRGSTLGLLIDAVEAALRGGPAVVLAAPAEEAPLWIGAVTFLAPPVAAAAISFSTGERYADVVRAAGRPDGSFTDEVTKVPGWRLPVLCVVPPDDVPTAPAGPADDLPLVVVDPRVQAVRVTVDGKPYRRTHLGQLVPVAQWSGVAQRAVAEDYPVLERCLERMDDEPPLPDEVDEIDPARSLAEALGATGGTVLTGVDDVLAPLRAAAGAAGRPEVQELLAATVRRLVEAPARAGAGGIASGLAALRAVDLAHRLSRQVPGLDLRAARVDSLAVVAAEALAGDPLTGHRGEWVAELAGALDGDALATWVHPPLAHLGALGGGWRRPGRSVGDRLPAPVLAALWPAVDVAQVVAEPAALQADPVLAELVVAVGSGRLAGDPRLRAAAVRHLVVTLAEAYSGADPERLVTEVLRVLREDGSSGWRAETLLQIARLGTPRFVAELAVPAMRHLSGWADDPAAGLLASALLEPVEELEQRPVGLTRGDVALLHLLAVSGEGWLRADGGLHHLAAEVLAWADGAWPGLSPQDRALVEPRVVVAAVQVALGAAAPIGPVGPAWQEAVTIGLHAALPYLTDLLRADDLRLAEALVAATTRAMVTPARTGANVVPGAVSRPSGDVPGVLDLPVEAILKPVLDGVGENVVARLARAVEGELPADLPSVYAAPVLRFWTGVLPGVRLRSGTVAAIEAIPAPETA